MSLISTLARPNILRMKAYRSARSIATEAQIYLDANEAPGPVRDDLNRYPNPQPPALVQAFSALYEVPAASIFVGRGSDEAIDVLTRTFCEPGQDSIMITPPTYGMYEVSADIQDAKVKKVSLLFDGESWSLDLKEMIAQANECKLIYVCSPNNPTGTAFPLNDIRELCTSTQQSLIVVDEAYAEFSKQDSAISLLNEFSNLVVLRTLSKAWGRAGLRCGVALAQPELIQLLQKVRAPYPLSQPVITLALQALEPRGGQAEMRKRVEQILSERQALTEKLKALTCINKVYTSSANFLLVRCESEAAVMRAASAGGILLRSRHSEPGLENCVRITVGNPQENRALLAALGGVK